MRSVCSGVRVSFRACNATEQVRWFVKSESFQQPFQKRRPDARARLVITAVTVPSNMQLQANISNVPSSKKNRKWSSSVGSECSGEMHRRNPQARCKMLMGSLGADVSKNSTLRIRLP